MSGKYEIGSVVFSNWIITNTIGEGSFGKVFEIQRSDDFTTEHSALKVITVPKSSAEVHSLIESGRTKEQAKNYLYSMVERIVDEIKIMSRLKATGNVVSYEDHEIIAHEDGMGWDILIRMELLHPLLAYACEHPFSRRNIIKIGIDICKALELCQKYNIIHRDIKPENIFVSDNGDYKLGDFGIARTIEGVGADLTKTGTYTYMAPEVYQGREYGFSVDIYSLGMVLYRLLNKNRSPFWPEQPKEITVDDQDAALKRRMGGEILPAPFYSQGRLPEIVIKACAPDPADRYSSPIQMRQELEAILYDESDSAQIYPDGDTLEIMRNYYATQKKKRQEESVRLEERTQSAFGKRTKVTGREQEHIGDGETQSPFGERPQGSEGYATGERTESPFGSRRGQIQEEGAPKYSKAQKEKGRVSGKVIGIVATVFIIIAGAIGFFAFRANQMALQEEAQRIEENYRFLMTEGMEIAESDPQKAKENFLEAQSIHPEAPDPFVAYGYALYMSGDYSGCITYIEDELGLGKQYSVEVQSQLSEILGAAYFEQEDYAAAASFFRLSTAGGDITVSAMRDYAVSLGRIGDYDAADEILQRMISAGADEDTTLYVQAEVDFAQKEYAEAESGFQSVLSDTADAVLQKRCVRSLAEVYRDCAALVRTGSSPIATPATKAVEVLANGIETYGLRYDSTLWEMLGLAYFESFHTDPSVPQTYLQNAADCFNRVIELGVHKDYLYSNLYTVYYEMGDYSAAEEALSEYEEQFPNDYMPHALRGMMLITLENAKPQNSRNYTKAVAEYEKAESLTKSSDDVTYLQQLESLVGQLRQEGWI